MKLAKKITLGVFIALLLGAVIGLGIWVARNYSKITSETDLYTYEELLDHGEKRYEDGLQAGEDNRVLVEAYLKQIHSLENQKEELSLEIVRLKAEGYDDKERIETLEAQQLEYQNEITRLNGLLKAYENLANEVYEVSFYIMQPNGNNVLYETKLVKLGNCVTNLIVPEETNEYSFKFWTLDKQTEVDPLTVEISANTTFYGVVAPKYEIQYIFPDTTITKYVVENTTLDLFESSPSNEYEIVGWKNESGEMVDMANVFATKDTSFTAEISLNIDYEMLEVAVINKIGDSNLCDSSSVTWVEFEYVSMEEQVLFVLYNTDFSTTDKGDLVYFDLTNGGEFNEEIQSNASLVEKVSSASVMEGYEFLYLLGEEFAIQYLKKEYCAQYKVEKAYFDYRLEKWMPKTYYLPSFNNDYILLTPIDILTKDSSWLNTKDMVDRFSIIVEKIPNEQLKFEINKNNKVAKINDNVINKISDYVGNLYVILSLYSFEIIFLL
mgnify:CR=1 FL=1